MKTVAIIANRKHKKAVELKLKLSKILPDTFRIYDKLTDRQGHATSLTLEAINENVDFIIAAGGDGTMNEVINGLMQSTEEQRNKVIVGLFPLGTGNDFARTANFNKSVDRLADLIVSEKNRKIDVGFVEFCDRNGDKKNRYFNNIAEVGVGAKATEIVNRSKKTLGSTLTFLLGVVRAFGGYKQQTVKINATDLQWAGKIVAVCIANGQYFGSGLGIAPGAKLDDGKLSMVIVGKITILQFLRYLPHLRNLKLINHPEVHYLKIDFCEITSEEKYPIEMDGESIGFTPFTAKVVPGAVNLLGEG